MIDLYQFFNHFRYILNFIFVKYFIDCDQIKQGRFKNFVSRLDFCYVIFSRIYHKGHPLCFSQKNFYLGSNERMWHFFQRINHFITHKCIFEAFLSCNGTSTSILFFEFNGYIRETNKVRKLNVCFCVKSCPTTKNTQKIYFCKNSHIDRFKSRVGR